MTRDSYLSRGGSLARWKVPQSGLGERATERGPYFVSGDCFSLIVKEERRHDASVVVIPCQKGVRLTYYRTNEVGGNFKRPCLSSCLPVWRGTKIITERKSVAAKAASNGTAIDGKRVT